MSRKFMVIAVVVAFAAPGCSGARAILRGQSPDHEQKPVVVSRRVDRAADLEWWADPRLARVGNQAERQQRRRSIVLAPLLLTAAVAAWLAVDDVENFLSSGTDSTTQSDPKVRVGGQSETPARPREKDKDDRHKDADDAR